MKDRKEWYDDATLPEPEYDNNKKTMEVIKAIERRETEIGRKLLQEFEIESVPSTVNNIDDLIHYIKINLKEKAQQNDTKGVLDWYTRNESITR